MIKELNIKNERKIYIYIKNIIFFFEITFDTSCKQSVRLGAWRERCPFVAMTTTWTTVIIYEEVKKKRKKKEQCVGGCWKLLLKQMNEVEMVRGGNKTKFK